MGGSGSWLPFGPELSVLVLTTVVGFEWCVELGRSMGNGERMSMVWGLRIGFSQSFPLGL